MRQNTYILLLLCLTLFSCNRNKTTQSSAPVASKILVDESFAPIIEDQYLVFQSSYPEAKIDLIYKPEVELLNLFLNDSINVAIMSRKLLPHEAKLYESKSINIRNIRIATDAIALITHQSSKDSTISADEIKNIMKGLPGDKNLVFDNQNSSTVRYLRELAGVKELPKEGVYALNSNVDVIKYVHNNPGTIGVIGMNWIKQPPVEIEPIVARLKTMGVKNSSGLAGSDKFYKPNQNNIALGLYAFTRDLYIIDCKGGTVGTSFAAFVAGERGQRIILKSGLLPNNIPPREIIIRKSINP